MINPLDIIIPMLFTPEFVSYNHVVLLGPPLPSFLAWMLAWMLFTNGNYFNSSSTWMQLCPLLLYKTTVSLSSLKLSSMKSQECKRDVCTHCLSNALSLARGHPQFTRLAFNFTHQTMVVYTDHSKQRKCNRTWQEHQAFRPSGEAESQIMTPKRSWKCYSYFRLAHPKSHGWDGNMWEHWSHHVFVWHWSDSLWKEHREK